MDRKVYFGIYGDIAKTALVENGALSRCFETKTDGRAGSIFRGKVLHVTSAGAFVDLGGSEGFLSDPTKRTGEYVTVLCEREAEGEKRARLNETLTVAGRYLVLTTEKVLHFSGEITQREELKELFFEVAGEFGVIFRSACAYSSIDKVREELLEKKVLLQQVIEQGKNLYKVGCLYPFFPKKNAENLSLDGVLYDYSEVEELTAELKKRAVCRDGVELVFDKTEAMTVIDVNNKRNFGRGVTKDFVKRFDLDAADFVAEQIRLRNLGGLIAVDFVNVDKDDFAEVKSRFDEDLRRDFLTAKAEYCDHSCVAIVIRKKQG